MPVEQPRGEVRSDLDIQVEHLLGPRPTAIERRNLYGRIHRLHDLGRDLRGEIQSRIPDPDQVIGFRIVVEFR